MSAVPEIAIGAPGNRSGLRVAVLVLAAVFALGTGALVYMLVTAPDSIPWSFVTANFVFLLGVSQFGTAFVAIMRICRTRWARPFYRTAELATLAFFPFAIVFYVLIFTFAREELFFWLPADPDAHLSPWLNADFLFYRNLIAQLVFYGMAWAYFQMGLLPDVTEETIKKSSGLTASVYRRLWSKRQRTDVAQVKSRLLRYSVIVLVIAVVAHTFIAWDFAMMLFPHYHSTVFPMYFIMGNMLAGAAAVFLLAAITSRVLDLSQFFQTFQLKSMGIVLTGFSLFWLYMFWAQFFVTWFGNLPNEMRPLWLQMFGHYMPYFWLMMVCVFGIPIGSMLFAATKRNLTSMLVVCVVVVFGVWLNRYLLIVPAGSPDHTPFSSLAEIVLVDGLFAGFLVAFLLLIQRFPMISEWEQRDAAGEEGPAY